MSSRVDQKFNTRPFEFANLCFSGTNGDGAERTFCQKHKIWRKLKNYV